MYVNHFFIIYDSLTYALYLYNEKFTLKTITMNS